MLSVDEALRLVLEHAEPTLASQPLEQALGLVLAEDVASDVDSPPHDKAMVDGYAVRSADVAEGVRELELLEEVTAGCVPRREVGRGQTSRVMTGAPIPPGADAMVMHERTLLVDGGAGVQRVHIAEPRVAAGQNIVRRAASLERGQAVLASGTLLRPIEIGVLAEVGRNRVRVFDRPTVAILSTGNELVPAEQVPGPGQIRNSNGPMLVAAAGRADATAIDLGIGRDDQAQLQDLIERGFAGRILLISGGVSAGVLDLVPAVLEKVGVRQIFHKIQLKPGKPLWFGVRQGDDHDTLVFGLPGNPVSSLVCFELFVRPAIRKLLGLPHEHQWQQARLAKEFNFRGDRPTYYPARLTGTADGVTVETLRWQGSSDLVALVNANALAYFPPGERHYPSGERVSVLYL